MTGRVAGKVVVVTGAGSIGPGWGNGKASAVLYAREGARVVACDKSEAALAETVAIIEGEGHSVTPDVCDVSDEAAVEALIGTALRTHGRLDVLHNNVGILGRLGGPAELPVEAWREVLEVNVTSMFLTCKHALPAMVAGGGGAIVNISSITSQTYIGYPAIAYMASKGAVNALTIGIAMEYAARGIRCNALLPGLMNTPMIREPLKDLYGPGGVAQMVAARDAQCPPGHMGDAWDVAEAALFLASDAARYINGALIPVDGGLQRRG